MENKNNEEKNNIDYLFTSKYVKKICRSVYRKNKKDINEFITLLEK